MSARQKKPVKKRYRSESLRVTRDTMRLAMSRMCVTPDELLERLRVRELSSIDAMARGLGTLQDVYDLFALNARAMQMGRDRVGPEVLPWCRLCEVYLAGAHRLLQVLDTVGLSAAGLHCLREVYAFHDLQRVSVSRAEYERALDRAAQAVRAMDPEIVEIAG